MELVAMLVEEPFSDAPRCAHPAIRALASELNDVLDDTMRQRLLALVPRIAESARTLEGVDVYSRFSELCRARLSPVEIPGVRLRAHYERSLEPPASAEKACDLIAGIAVLSPPKAITILDELLPERAVDEELAELACTVDPWARSSSGWIARDTENGPIESSPASISGSR